MSKAGELFKCVCCGEPAPEDEASYDPQFLGPVCGECRRNSTWATAYLKRWAKSDRPLLKSDINHYNYKRHTQ